MTYSTAVVPARFVDRPNRFIAHVEISDGLPDGLPDHGTGGHIVTVHVKNTGRCRELLLPHATVYLAVAGSRAGAPRKTAYDLVAVDKVREDGTVTTVNIDSQAANEVAAAWIPVSGLFAETATLRREVVCGGSRFDFCIENADGQGHTAYLEVKGCTLERNGVALFPDAPTERGVKHIKELTALAQKGIAAYLLFVIQMKGVRLLRPNDMTHPAFGDALREARKAGVKVLAVDCTVTPQTITADGFVPVDC